MKLLKVVRSIIRFAEVILIAVTILCMLVQCIVLLDPTMMESNCARKLTVFATMGITVENIRLYEIITIVTGLLLMLTGIIELRNTRLILDSAIAGKPFVSSTVRSLRLIGCCLLIDNILGELADLAYVHLCGYKTPLTAISISGFVSAIPISASFVTALLVLCLAQAFAYGVQLQEDVDGLL